MNECYASFSEHFGKKNADRHTCICLSGDESYAKLAADITEAGAHEKPFQFLFGQKLEIHTQYTPNKENNQALIALMFNDENQGFVLMEQIGDTMKLKMRPTGNHPIKVIEDNYFHVSEQHQLNLKFGFEFKDKKPFVAGVLLSSTDNKKSAKIERDEEDYGKLLGQSLKNSDLYWGGIPIVRVPEWLKEHMESINQETGKVQSLGACINFLNVNDDYRTVQARVRTEVFISYISHREFDQF